MSSPYPPVAVRLGSSITLPSDNVDYVKAAAVNVPLQAIADGLQWTTEHAVPSEFYRVEDALGWLDAAGGSPLGAVSSASWSWIYPIATFIQKPSGTTADRISVQCQFQDYQSVQPASATIEYQIGLACGTNKILLPCSSRIKKPASFDGEPTIILANGWVDTAIVVPGESLIVWLCGRITSGDNLGQVQGPYNATATLWRRV